MAATMPNYIPELITEIQFDGDPFCTYTDAVTCDAPLLQYRLGETSGNAVNTGSLGTGLNATYTGTPSYNQGGCLIPPAFVDESGGTNTQGYDSNGSVGLTAASSQYATIPTNATIDGISTDPTHAWTVEAWINPTTIQTFSTSSDSTAIVSRQYSTSNIPFTLGYGQITSAGTGSGIGNSTGSQVWVGFYNGGSSGPGWYVVPDPTALAAVDAGTWIHYVGTWDGIGLSLYRNGALVAVGVPTAGFIAAASSGLVSYIGKRWDSSGSVPYFNGKVDEVAVYNKALSATQVSTHYAAQRVRISPTWIDISPDVMTVQTQRGRTYELDAYQAGTVTVVLDDVDRKYDASNLNSPYNGGDPSFPWYRILPLRPIRIRAAANDLDNPDFENALSGTDWVALTSATISLDATNKYYGTQSLKVVTAASTGSGVRSQRVSMVWPRLEANAIVNKQLSPADVRLSAWVYADSGTDVRFYLQELDASNTVVATSPIQTITGASQVWTNVTLRYGLVQSTATQVQVVFDVGSNATATFHVDGVKVAPVWPVFRGYVDAWPETWEAPDYAETQLSAVDGFEPLTQAQMETAVLSPVAVGSSYTQMTSLLNLAYWPTKKRYITYSDASDTTYQMAAISGLQGTDYALTLLQDVANSELGSFFMGKDGNATFQDHDYRLNLFAVAGPLGSFSDDPADLSNGMLGYVNMVTSFDQQHITNDWTVSPDSSLAIPINGRAVSANSIRRYLRRSNTLSTRLNSSTTAQTVANNLVSRTSGEVRSDGSIFTNAILRVESISLQPLNTRDLWRQALQREISDVIYVARTPGIPGSGGTGIQGYFIIEQISWNMDSQSNPWQVTWQLSPLAFSLGAHPFQLDVSPYDNLDQSHPLI